MANDLNIASELASSHQLAIGAQRHIYCNRTLNMRAVRAIGYDMDYTLIHYKVEEWEKRAYQYAKAKLLSAGWPVKDLHFVHDLIVRGLVIDTQLGNVLKVNSFGYVKQGMHGTRAITHSDLRKMYGQVVVSLSQARFIFLNTLFSLSEACLYAQLIDLADAQALPRGLGYADLYEKVRSSVDEAHLEGELKAEIMSQPERYVELDPLLPLTLLDQRYAGKKLLLITNAEWRYTQVMLRYVLDPFLPSGMTWRNVFDLVFVAARKPDFFSQRAPLFEVVDDDGLLRPCQGELQEGKIYFGGDASVVEQHLGLAGDEILYVGDHIYGDVNVSKRLLRWRTALVLREMEAEVASLEQFAIKAAMLTQQMERKAILERELCHTKILQQRNLHGYTSVTAMDPEQLEQTIDRLRRAIELVDEEIRPLAEFAAHLSNPYWGPIMRAGNDKSHLARQVERYADIYMSRVSNFLGYTPFVYLRSMRGSLPHDPGVAISLERA